MFEFLTKGKREKKILLNRIDELEKRMRLVEIASNTHELEKRMRLVEIASNTRAHSEYDYPSGRYIRNITAVEAVTALAAHLNVTLEKKEGYSIPSSVQVIENDKKTML